MQIVVTSVDRGSPAFRAGLRAGDTIEGMDGAEIQDFIDWEYCAASEGFDIAFTDSRGRHRTARIAKRPGEPLGVETSAPLYPPERCCANRCVFCFVDQLPEGMRPTLHVKDDDWRYSMLFGNYVSLTNVTDGDMARIIARQVSPLYVSVHATDPDVRVRMMGNPRAAMLMDQLRELARGGIIFHCQVVLCPGYNDGDVLARTLEDLAGLYPAARSVAVVPVGLTDHRQGLPELRPVDRETALGIIRQVEDFAACCQGRFGERFVYAADEMYQRAGLPWPVYLDGAHTPQMSNGVGLMDDFITGFREGCRAARGKDLTPRRVLVATGVSAGDTINMLCRELAAQCPGLCVTVAQVKNRLFGASITVAGLMGARDIFAAVESLPRADELLIPASCVRDEDGLLLDDRDTAWLSEKLGMPVCLGPDDGYAFALALLGLDEGE